MKAVLRFTACGIVLIRLGAYRSTFMCMAWISVLIVTNEHGIMMTFRFIQHFLSDKLLHNTFIKSSREQKIRKHSPHIIIFCRQNKRLFLLWRLITVSNPRSGMTAEEHLHRIAIAFVVESADKVNAVAALLLVLMEPEIAPDRHLLSVVHPHIFRT